MNPVEKARDFLRGRQLAYKRTFKDLDAPRSDAAAVLADLAKFCRAHDSTFHPDPHVRAQLDGRREVWLRIQSHLQLTDDELWELHSKKGA